MNKNYIKIVYYACNCEYRVGVPEDESYKCKGMFGEKEYAMFYCVNCKRITPHVYCGYRTVKSQCKTKILNKD